MVVVVFVIAFWVNHILHDEIKWMKTLTEQIKKIKSQYDFPIWLIKETLEYHNGDEDKALEELRFFF